MIKYFKDSKGKFKEAYVYTNKNECLSCRNKGVAEYIDTLEKALDKACEELSRLNNDLDRRVITTPTYWKEWLLKEVYEDERKDKRICS